MSRKVSRSAAPAVSADLYDDSYYRSCCAGHKEWVASDGIAEAAIFRRALEMSGFEPGMAICDVGAGRGELVAIAAEEGASRAVGIEYSTAAVALSRQTIARRGVTDRAVVVLADARQLPAEDGVFDRVYMMDVIEHLAPAELDHALREAHRVLRPGGQLFAHTMPTRTIYDVTYRALRGVWRLSGRTWPADPRNEHERSMHVNEQTRTRLRTAVRRAGFHGADVTFGRWVYTDFVPSQRAVAMYRRLAGNRVTRPLAIADLWVTAVR